VATVLGHPNLFSGLSQIGRSARRAGRFYREYYDKRSRQLTERRYAADLELFGYSFLGVSRGR
jgi:hypothetical protein